MTRALIHLPSSLYSKLTYRQRPHSTSKMPLSANQATIGIKTYQKDENQLFKRTYNGATNINPASFRHKTGTIGYKPQLISTRQ